MSNYPSSHKSHSHRKKRRTHRRFHSAGEFEILRELGRGGYSTVFLAKNRSNGRRYALKRSERIRKGKDRSSRAWIEIDTLRCLKHSSGIIRLKGWFEDEDYVYSVLEYASELDLSKKFKKRLPSIRVVRDVIRQLVKIIKSCHRQSIIHRDIKLNNILINNKYKIKLIDFGLSIEKEYDDDYFYDEVGTPRYTAPEVLSGSGHDEMIDVWGIGIVMFMLLTGKYPFDGSRKRSIFRRILNKELDYGHYKIYDEAALLLKRLLCKDPRYRIRLDDIMKHEWFDSFEDED